MTLGEFDGCAAGVIVCPETIPPSEWLHLVWGNAVFGDTREAETAAGAVIGHYNRVARDLERDFKLYAPVYEIDDASGELLWEPWTDGFERAMRLRADAWERVVESGGEASVAVNMILAMNDIDHGRSDLTENTIDEIDRTASELIPNFVRILNAWTKSRGPGGGWPSAPQGPAFFGRKAGRNELCACGSGRKYKRCCGAH